MRLRLCAAIIFIYMWSVRAHAQDSAIGPAAIFRITPSTLPATCNTGDVRFNTLNSSLAFCVANVWNGFAGGGSITPPTNIALGGVFSGTVSTNQFVIGINNSGSIVGAQPNCGNLSNGVASCSVDATNANNISAGTLAAARLPTPTTASLGGVLAYVAVPNQWITSINTSGSASSTQPAFTNISGVATSAQLPTPTTAAIGGVMAYTKVANQFIDAINTNGSPSSSQVNFTNLAGTATSVQLPVPTTAAIGGVMAFAPVSNQWINSIGTNGSPTSTQPAFNNLSGIATIAQGGTNTGTTSQSFAFIGPTSGGGAPSFRALISSDLPATQPGNLSVSSTTASYTATATDNMIIAGSATGTASFAVTLPTPVGITGKEYCILDDGVNFLQNITIATAAGNIGGIASGSYILNTTGEQLCVYSDNANYRIRSHVTINTPQSFTPTFTAMGTVIIPANSIYWKRDGIYLEGWGSVTAGVATSVLWSMTLPPGATLSSTFLKPQNATGQASMIIGILQGNAANAQYQMLAAPATDATKVYTGSIFSGTTPLIPQSVNGGLSSVPVSFWFRVANQNWQP